MIFFYCMSKGNILSVCYQYRYNFIFFSIPLNYYLIPKKQNSLSLIFNLLNLLYDYCLHILLSCKVMDLGIITYYHLFIKNEVFLYNSPQIFNYFLGCSEMIFFELVVSLLS